MHEILPTSAVLNTEYSYLSFSFEFQNAVAAPSENQARAGRIHKIMSYCF